MARTHQALYRAYRPKKFEEVLGQEHIVSVLEAAIKNKKLSHAYLFSGGRGTGKTSVARIIAKELGTADSDLYEIDAASNRGIDDIRALKESVQTLPFQSSYKVYIVDEVHMLTKEAFNALLKTLEEPPAHVIFILATTELEKLPETIISRCQVFSFKKPTEKILGLMIQETAKKEGYTLEKGAAELIALLGDSSYRDTYGTLEKVCTFSKDKHLTISEIERVTGAPKRTLVERFITALVEKKEQEAFLVLRDVRIENIDMKLFGKLVITALRAIFLVRMEALSKEELQETLGESGALFITTVASNTKAHISSKTLDVFLSALPRIDTAAFVPELPLELAILESTR